VAAGMLKLYESCSVDSFQSAGLTGQRGADEPEAAVQRVHCRDACCTGAERTARGRSEHLVQLGIDAREGLVPLRSHGSVDGDTCVASKPKLTSHAQRGGEGARGLHTTLEHEIRKR